MDITSNKDLVLAVIDNAQTIENKELKLIPLPFLDPLPAEGEDEDEEEISESKALKKYEPIGDDQVGHILRAYAVSFTVSAMMSRSPLLVPELAGAGMDVAKKAFVFLPHKGAMRLVAYIALPALHLFSQNLTLPNPTANQMLRSIPWIYPCLGAARVDFNNHIHLKVMAKYLHTWSEKPEYADQRFVQMVHGITGYKKAFDGADALLKIILSLTALTLSDSFQIKACSSIIFKASARRIIDLLVEQLRPLQDTKKGRMFFAAYASGWLAFGVGGIANLVEGSHRTLDIALLVPFVDTAIRWPKARWKDRLEVEKKEKASSKQDDLVTLLKAGFVIGCLGAMNGVIAKGLTYALAPSNQQESSVLVGNFAAAFLSDIVSLLKVWSKQIGYEGMVKIAAFYLITMFCIYFPKEYLGAELKIGDVDLLDWLSWASSGSAALALSTEMYQERKNVVPPKKPKVKKSKIEEISLRKI